MGPGERAPLGNARALPHQIVRSFGCASAFATRDLEPEGAGGGSGGRLGQFVLCAARASVCSRPAPTKMKSQRDAGFGTRLRRRQRKHFSPAPGGRASKSGGDKSG